MYALYLCIHVYSIWQIKVFLFKIKTQIRLNVIRSLQCFLFVLTSECEGICSAVWCIWRRALIPEIRNKMIWEHQWPLSAVPGASGSHRHAGICSKSGPPAPQPKIPFLRSGTTSGYIVERAIRIFDNLSLLQLHQLIGSLVAPLVWLICYFEKQKSQRGSLTPRTFGRV